jgi:phosphoribosylformimino-5-aminoimidazole carboxamide ribonucleotide (ProFAR) isomerase
VFEQPDLLARCCERFGTRVALGLDYRRRDDGTMEAAVRGWTGGAGHAVDEFLAGLGDLALGAVIVTAIERDGTLEGPDLEGLDRVMAASGAPVVASGGVGSAGDLVALAALRSARGDRLAGAVVGKALVDGRLGVEEAIAACATSG